MRVVGGSWGLAMCNKVRAGGSLALLTCVLVLAVPVLAQGTEAVTSPPTLDPDQLRRASFHEGLAAVRMGEKYGYVDPLGRVAIAPRFDYANIFSEGLARVVVDGLSGYVDRSGAIVIGPRFERAYKFSEGLARVCAPPRQPSLLFRIARLVGYEDFHAYPCGYIDRTGKLVIDYQYLPATGFQGGHARVTTLDGRVGHIDRSGEFVAMRDGEREE